MGEGRGSAAIFLTLTGGLYPDGDGSAGCILTLMGGRILPIADRGKAFICNSDMRK